MKKNKNIFIGLLLVLLGIVYGLKSLNIFNINLLFKGWWTLFIIIPSFINIFKDEDKTGSILGVIIGILLFLGCRDIISFKIVGKLFIPILLIIAGISFIIKSIRINDIKNNANEIKGLSSCTIFSEKNINYDEDVFEGTKIVTVFGETNIDLRNSDIKNNSLIKSISVFGETNIFVPDNVKVKIVSNSIFGEAEDKTNNKKNKDNIILYINATSIFGSVNVK